MLKQIYLATAIMSIFISISFGEGPDYKGVRSRESFNHQWKFARFGASPDKAGVSVSEPDGIQNISYDDSNWRELKLPHDWGIEGPFRDDLENDTGLLPWRGIGWYRKHFVVPEQDSGKKVYVDFDGAMANARIWLNGEYVGEWPYGYSSFRLDLTPYLKFGAGNVIAVRLDTENWDSRWYPGAGIYRNVWLVKTEPVHIAHWGVYLTTPYITDEQGSLDIRVKVKNNSNRNHSVMVKSRIYKLDQSGKKGNSLIAETYLVGADIQSGGEHHFRLEGEVSAPRLWHPDRPELYLAETEVTSEGRVIDYYETTFGFRTLKFSASEGFFLNGKKFEIKGVCIHHDLGPLGSAFNTRAAERQLEILKEMGCNAIRTSHNPPAPELLDLCDRLGFLVQDEAFDAWRKGKKPKDYNLLFNSWHEEDLLSMVKRDRNHPSVFMWSTGNEIPDQWNPELSRRMTALVREEDPTRPVTVGCNWWGTLDNAFFKTVDVYGFNYNLWVYDKFFTTSLYDSIPVHSSESSSCVSTRGEYFFPVEEGNVKNLLTGKENFQVSSYDLQAPEWGYQPEKQFEFMDKYSRVFGEFVWTGFDYLGEPTPYNADITKLLNETDEKKIAQIHEWLNMLGSQEVPSRSSYFGINDLCGFKKDRFYIYQAHWRPDLPMAHILPHWNWPERIGKVTPVHVYTSGDEAELILNGNSLGRKKLGKFEYRFCWDNVVYMPGELIVVTWKNGVKWAEDVMRTTQNASKIKLDADRQTVNSDGQDLVFVTVSVRDNSDLIVPRTHHLIQFKLDGPGEIVATGNGDPTSHASFQAKEQEIFNGFCLVIIRPTDDSEGIINLTANSAGLKSAKIQVKSVRANQR